MQFLKKGAGKLLAAADYRHPQSALQESVGGNYPQSIVEAKPPTSQFLSNGYGNTC